MAGNHQIFVGRYLSNMSEIGLNHLPLLPACLLCRLISKSLRANEYYPQMSRTSSTTFEWAESDHTISTWSKLVLLSLNEPHHLILHPNAPNQLILPTNKLKQLISPLNEINEPNDQCVSFRAQRPICKLRSSTTYMWATDVNNSNSVQRALRTKAPLLCCKSGWIGARDVGYLFSM